MRTLILLMAISAFYITCKTAGTDKIPAKKLTTYRALFYNVENLFDTLNQEGARDGEFTPTGSKNWKGDKYRKKIVDIGMVFATAFREQEPLFIGLCEVENRQVLEDLVKSPFIQQHQLKVIHYESPDFRGIDVAMLYNPALFKPLYHESIAVTIPDSNFRTRDILYVVGHVQGIDTFHIFINHWPSRRGGLEKSEPKRLLAARILRNKVDSIMSAVDNAEIILTGDFNDEPLNNSISRTLSAQTEIVDSDSSYLYNMMSDTATLEHPGTYKYRHSWNMLDQFIVSTTFFNSKDAYFTYPDDAGVVDNGMFLMDDDRYPGSMPLRTYIGSEYLGGPSDHLAVYLDLHIRKK